jgi:competence protein ComEC
VLGESFKLNKKIENKIDSLQLKPTSIAFLKAFYLGNRNEIPEDITSDYKNAGVLHILALSGLHVGILLLFFKLLLRPLLWIKKGGQIRSISIICLLWIFALITGLSPSIVRAVSMFSLFVIAEMLNRQTNSINTLFHIGLYYFNHQAHAVFRCGISAELFGRLGHHNCKTKVRPYLDFKIQVY